MDGMTIGSILFAVLAVAVFAIMGFAHYFKRRRERRFDKVMASARKALAKCARANKQLADETGRTLLAMTDFIVAIIRMALESDENDQAEAGPELEFAIAWDKLPREVVFRLVEEFGDDIAERIINAGGF